MNKWLKSQVLHLKSEESTRVVHLFMFAFFVGIFVSFYYALANSLFIEAFGVSKLPHAYISSGVLGLMMMRGFTYLQSKIRLQVIFPSVFVLIMSILILGRFAGTYCEGCQIQEITAIVLFVLAAPLLTLTAICTSGLAFNLFDIRQNKRLFGLSVSGETFASILGYFLVPILVNNVLPYDYDLLFIAAFGAGGALLMLLIIFRKFAAQFHTNPIKNRIKEATSSNIFKNKYYVLIFLSVILSYVAIYFVDFGFLGGVALISGDDSTEIVGLIASFFMITKAAEFLFSLLSGRIIVSQGLKFSLVILPISILAATIVVIGVIQFGMQDTYGNGVGVLFVLFFFLAMSKFLDRVIRKSIDRPASRALYQTIPKSERVKLQSTIEGSAQLLGTFIAGGLLLLHGFINPVEIGNTLEEVLHISSFSLWFLPILIVWSVIMFMIYNNYRKKLTDIMQLGDSHPVKTLTPNEVGKNNISSFEKHVLLGAIHYPNENELNSLRSGSKLIDKSKNIITQIEAAESPRIKNRMLLEAAKQKAPTLKNYLVNLLTKPAHAPIASMTIPYYKDDIYDDLNAQFFKSTDLQVRSKIIEIFSKINTDKTKGGLFQLINFPTPEVQQKAIKSLHKIEYLATPIQKVNVETKINEYVSHVAWIYVTLQELKDESKAYNLVKLITERKEDLKKSILYLLGMLYGADKASLIEKNLKNTENIESRILALELLDNYVDNHLKVLVMPLFEDISLRKKLSLLEKHIPQQHFRSSESLKKRLENIIIRNYIKTGIVSKAEAIKLINSIFPDQNDSLNIASLYHHHPLIVETAAIALYTEDGEGFESKVNFLDSKKKTELTALFQHHKYQTHILQTKLSKLKALPLFNSQNIESLIPLALSMEYVKFNLGSQIHLTNDIIDDYFWLVDSGKLDGYMGDQEHISISAGEFILEKVHPSNDILYLEAIEVTECYKIKKDLVLDFLLSY